MTGRLNLNNEIRYIDTQYNWSDTSLNTWCATGHTTWFDNTGTRRIHDLIGTNGGVWWKSCFINEQEYFSVNSNRDINFRGETFKSNGKNIETIEEQGDRYIRYANGLQVCFIQTNVPANTTTPLTLPKPFINTQYALSVVNHGGSSSNCVIGYGSKTITDFSIKNVDYSPLFVDVIGIGRWK